MEQKTQAHRCYEQIRERIINGVYSPGKKLAVLHLTKELGAGPTPIREALSRLTQTGLVEVIENQGFKVPGLTEKGIGDLYQAYFQIENLVLALAMEKGDEKWGGQVVAALYELSLVEASGKIEKENYTRWAEANERFHAALASGCNSPLLMHIRQQLFVQFDRYFRLIFHIDSKPISVDHKGHKVLADAVLKRDRDLVHRLLKEQVKEGFAELLEKLKEHGVLG